MSGIGVVSCLHQPPPRAWANNAATAAEVAAATMVAIPNSPFRRSIAAGAFHHFTVYNQAPMATHHAAMKTISIDWAKSVIGNIIIVAVCVCYRVVSCQSAFGTEQQKAAVPLLKVLSAGANLRNDVKNDCLGRSPLMSLLGAQEHSRHRGGCHLTRPGKELPEIRGSSRLVFGQLLRIVIMMTIFADLDLARFHCFGNDAFERDGEHAVLIRSVLHLDEVG